MDLTQLPNPILTKNAKEVLKRRYLKKDENGNPVETPKDMFFRVAKTVAQEGEKYEDEDNTLAFYEMMAKGYWLPNSPTLMNAGRPLGQLSACFVLPVEDCMSNGEDGIYDTLKDMALIHQSGGGTGFSFSRLRPNGSIVKSTTGVASGPVSFMSLYDASTNVVKQGGTRRGANMGILRVDHPDILEFINCKQDTSKIVNFNISVAVTEDFMEKAKNGEDYYLIDHNGNATGSLNAKEVLDQIIENAWNTGEPGLFFIDEANKWNPVPHLGKYEATNPCGEQPLLPYDVCNLGSLNLSKYVDFDKNILWDALREHIHLSTRFLDNVIDANQYPLPKIRNLAQRIRRIGNGVMGFADMLIKLGIPYDSEKGLEIAEEVAKFFYEECLNASERLAEERGVFSEWEDSIWGPNDSRRVTRRLRNCNVNTVAPTGTISIIAGCSSGIEPLFAVAFERRQAGTVMHDVHPEFINVLRKYDVYSEELVKEIAENGFDSTGIHQKIPDDLVLIPETGVFRTANFIDSDFHVRMQSVWQKHCDSAISKTINFSKEATIDDVKKAYMLAYDLKCKGITVYRDGSRPEQVLSTGKTEKIESEDRPEHLSGTTHSIRSPVGKMYVTVNEKGGSPYEVFVNVGKAGGEVTAQSEAIGRLVSMALQHGIPIEEPYRQLRGISSERAIGFGRNKVLSGPDAVAQVLQHYINGDVSVAMAENIGACTECGSALVFAEGCMKCPSCGFSECN